MAEPFKRRQFHPVKRCGAMTKLRGKYFDSGWVFDGKVGEMWPQEEMWAMCCTFDDIAKIKTTEDV